MYPNKYSLFGAALLAGFIFTGCNKSADSTGDSKQAPGAKSIAVIPKGTTHVFWKSVEAGAQQAGKELGVNVLWKGPLKENDRAQQISIVEQFASEGVNGIVLAPLDDTALRRPVQGAMEKNTPVVIMDSPLKGQAGKDFVGYVGTDNFHGGEIGGEELARLIGGKGKVFLLRYMEGSASTTQREEGFMKAIKNHPDIQLIADNRYGGATASEAQSAAMNMLDQIREADGIFCSNESLTFGMVLALRQNGLAGKAKFVGFDSSGPLVDALKKNEIQALVAQNPRKMGYEAVKAIVAKLGGKEVPAATDSGVKLITPETLPSQEIQDLLKGQL
jgi:ribose transport system substrate-binding protein